MCLRIGRKWQREAKWVPARKVESFDALLQKRIREEHDRTIAITQDLTDQEITEAWNILNKLYGYRDQKNANESRPNR